MTILGTMTFGQQVNMSESEQMLSRFLQEGYTEVDTAHVYNDGDSERYIGSAIRSLKTKHSLVSTKVNPRIAKQFDLSTVKYQLEESLKRLGLQRVDVLYLHFPDPRTPLNTTLEACAKLYEEGKFSKLGLSNFPAWQVTEAWNLCKRNHWPMPKIYQGLYNALSRGIESKLLTTWEEHGISFYAYNPLAGGMLAEKYSDVNKEPGRGRFEYRPNYRDRYWKKVFLTP